MKFVSNTLGCCPCCNGNNLEYDEIEITDIENVYFPYTCKDCKAQGEEWYTLMFAGHNVEDENGDWIDVNNGF